MLKPYGSVSSKAALTPLLLPQEVTSGHIWVKRGAQRRLTLLRNTAQRILLEPAALAARDGATTRVRDLADPRSDLCDRQLYQHRFLRGSVASSDLHRARGRRFLVDRAGSASSGPYACRMSCLRDT